jgi:hypothetical protein
MGSSPIALTNSLADSASAARHGDSPKFSSP